MRGGTLWALQVQASCFSSSEESMADTEECGRQNSGAFFQQITMIPVLMKMRKMDLTTSGRSELMLVHGDY